MNICTDTFLLQSTKPAFSG